MQALGPREIVELTMCRAVHSGAHNLNVHTVYRLEDDEISQIRMNQNRGPIPYIYIVLATGNDGLHLHYSLQYEGCRAQDVEFVTPAEVEAPRTSKKERALDALRQGGNDEDIEYLPGERMYAMLEVRYGIIPQALHDLFCQVTEQHGSRVLDLHSEGPLVGLRHYS